MNQGFNKKLNNSRLYTRLFRKKNRYTRKPSQAMVIIKVIGEGIGFLLVLAGAVLGLITIGVLMK